MTRDTNAASVDTALCSSYCNYQDAEHPDHSTFCPVGGTSASQRKDTSLKTALAEGNSWMHMAVPTQRRRASVNAPRLTTGGVLGRGLRGNGAGAAYVWSN